MADDFLSKAEIANRKRVEAVIATFGLCTCPKMDIAYGGPCGQCFKEGKKMLEEQTSVTAHTATDGTDTPAGTKQP